MNALNKISETDRYARCVQTSKRVRWDIDADVIRERRFVSRLGHQVMEQDALLQRRQRLARRVTRDAAEPSRTNATSLPRSFTTNHAPSRIRQTEKHKSSLPIRL
jgi:hypothetical protein